MLFILCWYLLRLWVQSILDVTLPNNAEVSNDFDGRVPEHVVFIVIERLTRRHHNGFSRMDSQRVDVLHVTHLNEKKQSECAGFYSVFTL